MTTSPTTAAATPVEITSAEADLLISALNERRWERARFERAPSGGHDACCPQKAARDQRHEEVREAIRKELAALDALLAKLRAAL